jgi:rhodanese-related sulfurtransferase
MKHINVQELYTILSQNPGLKLVDVRSLDEFRVGHIPQAISVPLDLILSDTKSAIDTINQQLQDQETIYVVCLSDRRSFMACHKLLESDVHNVCFLQGGTKAWASEGYPIVTES